MIARALSLLSAAALLVTASVACGGSGEVGEACDTPGSTDECVEGAICDQLDDQVVCLQVCEEQSDCAVDESCNGVSGSSTKACHPDEGGFGSGGADGGDGKKDE